MTDTPGPNWRGGSWAGLDDSWSGAPYPYAALAAAERQRRMAVVAAEAVHMREEVEAVLTPVAQRPGVLLAAGIITLGDRTAEGRLVEAVAFPWFEIIRLIERDPNAVYRFGWREWEEIVAGAYHEAGCDEVTLTPRSDDGGRDVIAVFRGMGSIRIFDQVKAYKPGHLVPAKDFRELVGVLTIDPNVSKGILTTTSDFAPGVLTDPKIAALMPYRLELRPRDKLIPWLASLAARKLPTQ